MAFRVSPVLWPILAIASPALVPWLWVKNRRFRGNRAAAERSNRERIERAFPLALPELEFVEIAVLVEEKTEDGFLGAPGVSYLLTTDCGALLFDLGFGPERPTLVHNADRLGIDTGGVDALVISHLHGDHMGGLGASKTRNVSVPRELGLPTGLPCFVPAESGADGFEPRVVEAPELLAAGFASTGPLTRGLFFLGPCHEQALVARIKGKGLVVVTGCGHPGIEVILEMVGRLSDEPVHAVAGGLHFPVTESRLRVRGQQVQMLMGTGKPPWQRIDDDDLGRAIATFNRFGVERVLLSAHDTCDYALNRFAGELKAGTEVLKAGGRYRI
jgi:7,8-dihydropterin-6-yl-methyl-4-(beta-D-ribofuranosyl)aminobenzene 5'-phosphate synthase